MIKTTHLSVDVIQLINRVQLLLDHQQPKEALKSIEQSGMSNQAVQNARGVCLLRLGQYEAAMRVFRDLVFPHGAFSIPPEIPTVLQTNYVTSLFCQNDLSGGMSLLKEIPDKRHAAVKQLKGVVREWKRSTAWWQRILFVFSLHTGQPLHLDFPPGALWPVEVIQPSHPKDHVA